VILPSRETDPLNHYLAQIAVLNRVAQRHFVSINAGNYEGPSKQKYEKQLQQVRHAHKRLIEHRKVTSLQSKEQERSTFSMASAAGSSN
jgi:hypothetical protein